MTYEYLCKSADCEHRWEASQKITDPELVVCPVCKKDTALRLISGGTQRKAILKGSGWYKDGY